MQCILKQNPNDFQVFESSILPIIDSTEMLPITYLKLRKCGYTTFEAVHTLANFFKLRQEEVTFCGLKDEDGITEQSIAVCSSITEEQVKKFNLIHYICQNSANFMSIHIQGRGKKPLEIGNLLGNAFQITMRNIPESFAKNINKLDRKNFLFINYYDTQRFGINGYPKIAHLIGRNLLDQNYSKALDLFKISGNTEIDKIKYFANEPEEFFKFIDSRKRCFFLNSYSSYLWNKKILEFIKKKIKTRYTEFQEEEHKFLFIHDSNLLLEVIKYAPSIPMVRYHLNGSNYQIKEGERPTVIQSFIKIKQAGNDKYYPGSLEYSIQFFLPSGCYATMLAKQIGFISTF